MKYLLQLLILSSCHMIHGVLEWIVVEKVTDYGQNVTLFCNVSNCCPKLAGWDRWTPVQRTLYIDVKTGRPTKKYDGKALKDGYTLVIKNLTKQDLNVSYSCLYDVTLGERKFLLEEDVFINTSSTQPAGPFVDIRIADGKIVGISLGVVAVTVAFFIFFVWKQRAKRSKRIRNSIEVPEEAVPLIDYFLEDPCNIECIEGQEAIFTCKVGPNSPFVKWFKDGNAIKQSENCIISIVDKQHKLKIQNTKPNDRGEYCVVVGEFSRKVQLNIKVPLPPYGLNATAGMNGINLTWNPPRCPYFGGDSNYEIRRTINGHTDKFIVLADRTFKLMSDVFPSQIYSFAVKACCTKLNWKSKYSEYIQCKAKEPLPPRDLKAVPVFNGIYITWAAPEYPVIDKIRHFILKFNSETINVKPEKTRKTLHNVYPSKDYTIRMATSATSGRMKKKDEKASCGIETESEYTDELKCRTTEPLPPSDLKAVYGFDGIRITWSAPEFPLKKKIRHFILKVNSEIINVAPDENSWIVSNVYPSNDYTIQMATSARSGSKNKTDVNASNASCGFHTESEYTDELKCKTTALCEETIKKEKKRNFLPSEKHFHMANSSVVQKIEEKTSESNLAEEMPYLETEADLLDALLKDHKEAIFGTRDLHHLEVRTWKKGTDNFNVKCSIDDLQKELEDSSCVTLVGTENEEVNAILHHIALSFVEQNECYVIIPCKSPVEVVNHYKLDRHQLFVLKDACGRFIPVQESVQYLIEHDRNFEQMVQAGKTKIMISFTACVYWKTIFSKTDVFFMKHIKDLAPEYSDQFAPQQIVRKDEFEITWRDQLDNWFLNDTSKHCALFVTTINDGCISTLCFKQDETQLDGRMQQILQKYSLECDEVRASLLDHSESFILKDGDQYRISNSTMFHFLCCYFCAHKYLQDLFLQLVDGKVFYGKLLLECTQTHVDGDFVSVNISQEERYFSRILDDVSRKDYSVFYSRQMQVPVFRRKLIVQVSKIGGVWTIGIINTKELQEIAITGKFQRSPLLVACSHGYEELVSFMLRHVDNNIKDKTVSALFRITVDQGYPLSVVKLLKSSGANLKFVWDDSWTALNAACQQGNQDIANFLIDEGSIFNTVDALGTTPLMLACYTGLNETVQLLIKKGVDINVLNNRKMSALKYACISGHKNIVSLLLDNEADSSTVYHDGRTPLVIAFEEKHDHILTLLKNKGFDVESRDKLGQTALAMACTNGDRDTVKSLIKLGANINSRDNKGWVPLSRACKRGSEEIVDVLLLEETIDLNIEDNYGWTPLKKASLNGHSKIVDILLNTHKLEIDKADNDGWTPLMSSCQKGHVTVSELLICNNADVNHRSNDGVTPLMTATQNDHIAVINLLLENNADVDLDNNDGWTPLRVACNANTEKAVGILLMKRPDVDKPDKKGYTPLKIACRNGYYKISSLLIEEGADVNRKDNDGWTPVQTACKTGHLKICKLLLSHKADINIADFSRCTPLHIASRSGQTDIVEWLLKNNAKIDQLNDDGWTALMSACQFGYKNIANLLLKNGSCVNHQSVKKLTPLIAACQNNNNEVIDILIKNEANVNFFNVDGWTPLHFTCMRGHIKASEILIQNGADVNKADNKGWTPLKFACRKKKASLVQILINAKADVNVVDKDGWTPLKTACRVGDEDTVEVLLNNNADINKEDKEGWTPLISASVNEHYKIVKRLLLKNADINKVDHEGWTSLMSACKVGNFKVINILLEYKADVNCYSESTGDTPLTIACTNSDGGEIIKLLLEKGADWKKPNNIGQTALILACMHGKTQNVSKLLDYRVDTDVTDKNGVSPLKAACHGLYLEIVELLIKAGANIDIADLNGYTPLISACETQNLQLVELLIHNKADVDKSTPGGWNPYLIAIKTHNDEIANLLIKKGADKSKPSLLKACEIGHLPIIEFLLDQDRSIESKEIGVMTPLKMVIEKRQFVVLDLFIKKGRTFELDHSMLKDLIHDFDEEDLSALTKACRDANTKTLIYLLEHGADIFQPDKRGISPLIYACLNGNKHNVDLLLEKLEKVVDENSKIVLDSCRSYLNKADNDGYTPLTAASSRGHVPLIELLILNGTDVDKLDDCGKAPIMYACENGDLHTVKSLVSNGASITIISDKACSPLTLAKQANAWQIVDYFIEMGIRLNHEDLLSISATESGNEKRDENDFFTMACKNEYKALVELIIDEKQADLNSPDCEGLTPLMHACMMNQTKIVEIIVKKKIDIDSETSGGKTALMFACVEGYTDTAEILLKNHANVNKCDNSGLTSLMIACEKGSLSCIKLLMKYGADMDIKSSAELSAFKIACHIGNYEIVDHLVSQESYKPLKYDVRKLLDRTHSNGKELIQSVCKGGYESLFNILIESEAEIEAADGDGNSLLMLASQGGHDGIIENLVTRRANTNHKNQIGQTALRMACNGGLARSVEILLKNDAHPNKTDAEGRTPLMIVSQGSCLDVVETLIQHGADIDLGDMKGTTALMLAAKHGQYDTAEYLVSKGADISKCDNKGLNSLMVACQNGHIAIVRLIARTKIDINSNDNDGFTPLRFACDGGHNDIADFLIQNKAEVDKADNRCWTPLKSSCFIGTFSTVELLLEKNADVNKQDKEGWTPLMSACQNGHDNIAELLLNWKAGIDMTEVDGWTALRIACINGKASTVKFLVSKGADVNKVDKQGWSPLKGACVGDLKNKLSSGLKFEKIVGLPKECETESSFDLITSKKYEEIVTCLIQNDADVNLVDTDGWTCLMSACQSGHIDIVNLLFSNIIDIDKANSNGSTAFSIACSMGHTKVAVLLLTHGADIDKANSDGWTPLKIACQIGNKDTVNMLLRNEANVNIEDKDGWTALMSACKNGNREIVQSLLENKADVEYIAHDGSTTPIKIARKFGHRRVERLLKRALKGSINDGGDEEDDQEDDEDDEESNRRRIGRISLPFQLTFSNDSDEDDDDDCKNLPPGFLESMLENDDLNSDNSPGCPVS